MITNYHSYENGYISLANLPLQNLPESINAHGYTLVRKSEFHITLLCTKRIANLIDAANAPAIEAQLVDDFIAFNTIQPLTYFVTSKEFRFVARENRKSVIVLADVPHLIDFFATLRNKYPVALPLQPTHATLYTLPSESGIGILSHEELLRDSEVIELPSLETFANGGQL